MNNLSQVKLAIYFTIGATFVAAVGAALSTSSADDQERLGRTIHYLGMLAMLIGFLSIFGRVYATQERKPLFAFGRRRLKKQPKKADLLIVEQENTIHLLGQNKFNTITLTSSNDPAQLSRRSHPPINNGFTF